MHFQNLMPVIESFLSPAHAAHVGTCFFHQIWSSNMTVKRCSQEEGHFGPHAYIVASDVNSESVATSPSILQEADSIINGDRQKEYGSPLQSFTRIAALWSPVLGVEVTAEQVALCMIGVKVSRYMNGQQRDSIVDIAGYAGCLELMKKERDGD
jgi:hypothetical protein